MMTASAQHILFSSSSPGAIPLVGTLTVSPSAQGNPGVMLCHWAPAAEVSNDTLLSSIESQLAARGTTTLRLNVCDAHRRPDTFAEGDPILLDLAGAIEFLLSRPRVCASSLFLVGHGFGSVVALACARADHRVAALAAVSPPLYLADTALPGVSCPTLLLTGELDEVCPPDELSALAPRLAASPMVETIPGARHMLRGHEREAAALVTAFLELHTATAVS
ncbi:MAG TPA: dienelactone hydrolase family protein [Ktedonobacterales bacterium]